MSLLFQLKKFVSKSSRRRLNLERAWTGLESLETRTLMTASSLLAGDSSASSGFARIINGTVTSQYATVGKVGDASDYYGSGTLIAPQYVLTAGHCAEGVSDTGGRFFVNGQEYKTSKVFMHPNYNVDLLGEDAANDIAIFKLDRPVTGVTPSPIYRATPTVGQLLTLVGFGYGGTGTTGSDEIYGTKRVGTTPIDSVSAKLINWDFTTNSESNTAPGDSGGPAFVSVGGVNYVAGVTSGGNQDNAGIGDNSFDTRVDAFAAWIDSIVGSSVSAVTVGIKASDAKAAETSAGQAANSGQYVITRTGDTNAALTVNLQVRGTATAGTDYNSLPATVTIPAGATSVTVPLIVKDDAVSETTETVVVSVLAGSGYSIDSAATAATVSVADNDAVKSNNHFANRLLLSGTSVQTTGTNVGATRESGEPVHGGITGGKSVWWSWTATSSGPVTISTAGSSFDTTLGVYRGTAVNSLTRVASNDDENFDNDIYTSKLTFNAVAGTTYQIAVDGYDGEAGSIRLSLQQTSVKSTPRKNSAPSQSGSTSENASLIHSNNRSNHRHHGPSTTRVNTQASRHSGLTTSESRSFRLTPGDSETEAVFSDCIGSILDGIRNSA
jgi:secreted trypsin-like serine protease